VESDPKIKVLLETAADILDYGALVRSVLVNAWLWALPLLLSRFSWLTGPDASS